MAERLFARSEFILGGQRSGKSRRAEALAKAWLAQSAAHAAVLIATGLPLDEEMRARIAQHRSGRAERVPSMTTVEVSVDLAYALTVHSQPRTLVIIDCLTLWLTQLLMPMHEADLASGVTVDDAMQALLDAIVQAPGPVVLVGNEIGLGVIPMGQASRQFVDALGGLNQAVAHACDVVTFMAAGLPLSLKAPS
jgi:adenosylcobinamide kinase / adenosylcobinamide-phosphate guanylyltransferase